MIKIDNGIESPKNLITQEIMHKVRNGFRLGKKAITH